MHRGHITPDVIRRMCYYVVAAEAIGVDAIFSVCSSLCPATDVASELVDIPVVKIDEAMNNPASLIEAIMLGATMVAFR